ncbi:ribbon-helix-helix domain-containing protein [Ancylobacter amanitiformis]|uniref:DNA-binding ribbon-helix-helix protein n=1 Tax=Ancylobacter amanitiformis TaxID=217069 RepID=A0ABU0LQF8_9HYPH|nr:ribbon-helix-helix domain-containing protein [Ancylobacter amanitiformis]MDQ0510942.1 putative DNA-binding ribbon-helix-helix protein [Ancylobacter amanitiformis]
MSKILKRSLVIAGHKTSISLENEFFDAFKALAAREGKTMSALAGEIDAVRAPHNNLSSAIRLRVLADLQASSPAPVAP